MPLFHDPALTHRIIGLAMRVDARLGPGLLASVYERCLCHEFDRDGLSYARQVDLTLDYDGTLIACGYRADLIIRDGVLLELSPTEFDLLAYLVSEAPRVVSPQELIREVQGYSSTAQEAAETIRSHMSHIRRKAQSAAGRSVVRTARGIGYAVDE